MKEHPLKHWSYSLVGPKSAFQNEIPSRVASAEGRPSPAAQAAGRWAGTGSAKRARRDTGRSIAPVLGGRLIVISTSTAADEQNHSRPTGEAKLFVYDVSEQK